MTSYRRGGNVDAVWETQAAQSDKLSDDEFIDGSEASVNKKLKMFYRKQFSDNVWHESTTEYDNLSKHRKGAWYIYILW